MTYRNKLFIAFALFLTALVLAIMLGSVFIPPASVFATFAAHLSPGNAVRDASEYDTIIWFVRLPRALVAAFAGMALAAAGAFMQGVFRNPMADPGIIGVSSGASLGAVICIAFNLTALGIWAMPLAAAFGAIAATITVVAIARKNGSLPALRLLLSGVATSMFFGAITYIVLMNIAGDKVKQFLFWTTGNFNSSVWSNAWMVLIPLAILLLTTASYLRDMNLLLTGDAQAHSLGINPGRTRMLFMFAAAALAASAVCVGGNISFIGLIIPHICRRFSGSDYRKLLPLCIFGGAALLLLCDMLSRTLLNDISVGIVTSLIGVPYFIMLLRNNP